MCLLYLILETLRTYGVNIVFSDSFL